jgi:hypothetical protein
MRPRSPQRSGASDTDQHLLSRDIAQGRRGLEEFGTTIAPRNIRQRRLTMSFITKKHIAQP